MAGTLRLVAAVVVAVWVAWNVYRHLAVYLLRGRVVVVTERVLFSLVVGAGLLVYLAAPTPATFVIAVLAAAAGSVLRFGGIWVTGGLPADRVFERAGLVLRGMSFRFDHGERHIRENGGRIRLSIAALLTSRVLVLRLRSARGINKVALFRANLRKFLVALPRQRR